MDLSSALAHIPSELFTEHRNMDGMDSTVVESPIGSDLNTPEVETSSKDALNSLKVYMNSVPYACESLEEMELKLETIISYIVVAAKSSEWRALSTWFGMLQSWMAMKYPLSKPMRIRLVKLLYELILVCAVYYVHLTKLKNSIRCPPPIQAW
jgi:proteasome activator subunit 4